MKNHLMKVRRDVRILIGEKGEFDKIVSKIIVCEGGESGESRL
jgi:hypothetical protein